MLLRGVLCAAAFACAAPALAAERGLARNGLSVAGTADRFEVYSRVGLGGRDYFCAAADFARTHLGARATDRVVILNGLGPSRTRPDRRSVVFGLRPPGTGRSTAFGSIVLRPRDVGLSRTVATGENYCRSPEVREGDD